MRQLLSFVLLALITGCSSTEPAVNSSQAYSIASETYLTKDYSIFFKKYRSYLRDYSLKDLELLKQSEMKNSSPGNLPIAFGIFSVITGDFTGAIDIAGGTAANIANSNHRTARSLWFASIDAKGVDDGLKATNLVRETIQNKAIKILNEHGVELKKVIIKPERLSTFGGKIYKETAYKSIQTDSIYGFNFDEFYLQREKLAMVLGNAGLIEASKQYVSSPQTIYHGLYFFNKRYLIENKITPFNNENGFELFILELTSRLPEGYFYYCSPSMSRNNIPAIYMKGIKYQFISSDLEKKLSLVAL